MAATMNAAKRISQLFKVFVKNHESPHLETDVCLSQRNW